MLTMIQCLFESRHHHHHSCRVECRRIFLCFEGQQEISQPVVVEQIPTQKSRCSREQLTSISRSVLPSCGHKHLWWVWEVDVGCWPWSFRLRAFATVELDTQKILSHASSFFRNNFSCKNCCLNNTKIFQLRCCCPLLNQNNSPERDWVKLHCAVQKKKKRVRWSAHKPHY